MIDNTKKSSFLKWITSKKW